MNALEREIDKEVNRMKGPIADVYNDGFSQGANFILEKNLTILFLPWYSFHFETHTTTQAYCHTPIQGYFEFGDVYDFQKIYDYWLFYIYGK